MSKPEKIRELKEFPISSVSNIVIELKKFCYSFYRNHSDRVTFTITSNVVIKNNSRVLANFMCEYKTTHSTQNVKAEKGRLIISKGTLWGKDNEENTQLASFIKKELFNTLMVNLTNDFGYLKDKLIDRDSSEIGVNYEQI